MEAADVPMNLGSEAAVNEPDNAPANETANSENLVTPCVGHVHRSKRVQMLQGWPPLDSQDARLPFQHLNRPACLECGSLARPAILMFGDGDWLDNDAQEYRFHDWQKAVAAEAATRKEPPLKVCIVEIGAG